MLNKIERNFREKRFSKITRQIAKDVFQLNSGYIIDYSEQFVLVEEITDFSSAGFNIFNTEQIVKIRSNKTDNYYDEIMEKEGKKKNIGIATKLYLKDWSSLFKSLQKKYPAVIIECEDPELDSFFIGPITKVTSKKVYIHYFDAEGYLDEKPSSIKFKDISKVTFGDNYSATFSKYTRKKKTKKRKKKS